MKILLAVDDSRHSQVATQALIHHMVGTGTEVCVLHVVEPIWIVLDYESGELGEIDASREERLTRGKGLVEAVRQELAKAGFSVTGAVDEGDPRLGIVDYARQWNADLVVVGSHGRQGLGRLLIGSVAESVARNSHCSVMIVRSNAGT